MSNTTTTKICENVQLLDDMNSWDIPEFHESVCATIKFWTLKARTRFHLNAKQLPMPILSYNLRGNIAGQAFYREHVIKINPVFLQTQTWDMINNTIPHEICHFVTHAVHNFPVYPHGKEWRNICLDMGHTPQTYCHYGKYKTNVQQVSNMINKMSNEDF